LQEYFLLFIITNQSGISKGITTDFEVELVNKYIVETLLFNGIIINQVFGCRHKTEDNCICRKQKSYFIKLADELFNLNLRKSFIVDNHPCNEEECGLNVGLTPIYVLTNQGNKHRETN